MKQRKPASVVAAIVNFAIASVVGILLSLLNIANGHPLPGLIAVVVFMPAVLGLGFLIFLRNPWVRIYTLVVLAPLAAISTLGGIARIFLGTEPLLSVVLKLIFSGLLWWLVYSLVFGKAARKYFATTNEERVDSSIGA